MIRAARLDPGDLAHRLRGRPPSWWALQSAVTATVLWLGWRAVPPAAGWIWSGADWDVVADNLRLFALFRFPQDHGWRAGASLVVAAGLLGAFAARGRPARPIAAALAATLSLLAAAPWLAAPLRAGGSSLAEVAAALRPARPWFVAALAALLAARALAASAGPRLGAAQRRTLARAALLVAPTAIAALLLGAPGGVGRWGGLLLTLVLAATAIGLSLPLGVLLALGRRSALPLVRIASTAFIELMRGVPLITVLFMAAILTPLVLPDGWRPAAMLRAMIGLTLFSAAYVAEDVRGGLNAVGAGQRDAARALGLGAVATNRLVVLPQALRIVVPAIVGQLIALLKDTSLVFIVGLTDVFEVARSVVSQPEHLGRFRESLAFAALVYFVLCSALARASRTLESPGEGRP